MAVWPRGACRADSDGMPNESSTELNGDHCGPLTFGRPPFNSGRQRRGRTRKLTKMQLPTNCCNT
eukprot:7333696-Pyramimonas_sp.AAC.1